jgi:hypothetical protein
MSNEPQPVPEKGLFYVICVGGFGLPRMVHGPFREEAKAEEKALRDAESSKQQHIVVQARRSYFVRVEAEDYSP